MNYIAIIYGVTVVISIIVAWLLVRLTRSTIHPEIKEVKKAEKKEYSSPDIYQDKSLRPVIFNEVSKLSVSRSRSNEVTEMMLGIFNRELDERIRANSERLTSEREEIVKQKAESEELAWQKYKKVLVDQKETEAVIHGVAAGLVVVDAQGNVIMMNPAAEDILGISKKEGIGSPIADKLKEEHLLSLVKGPRSNGDREIEIVSKDDETKKIVRSSSAVIEDEHGHTVGMVSILSDITKQKELDKMKASFVSNVTHELRTPLVTVQRAMDLLLNKEVAEVAETRERILSAAERNLKRLNILIDDLLDLSKLEAKSMKLKCEPVVIKKLINEAITDFEAWAKTKSINIEKRIDEDITEFNLDPERINQVLNNLIGNAMKFTPKNGNITVRAALKGGDGRLEVSVEDSGIGIDEENLSKIFNRFYQVGERVPTDISGTGIGLSIAKEIVELHGGKIWAESKKGRGARFVFNIPQSSASFVTS